MIMYLYALLILVIAALLVLAWPLAIVAGIAWWAVARGNRRAQLRAEARHRALYGF